MSAPAVGGSRKNDYKEGVGFLKIIIMKFFITFTIFLFLISCSKDDAMNSPGNLNSELEKFYTQNKVIIDDLNRVEFSSLNKDLQLVAYENFPTTKKSSFWKEKLEQVLRLNSLNEKQKMYVKKVRNMISNSIFNDNYDSKDLINFIFEEGYEVGFNEHSIYHIFGSLNSIDANFELLNVCDSNSITSSSTSLNLNGVELLFSDQNMDAGWGDNGGGDKLNCNTAACWLCRPAYYDCNGKCKVKDRGCGIFGLMSCERRCF